MSCEFWLWRLGDAEPKAIKPYSIIRFLNNGFKICQTYIQNERMKYVKPKANSRGFLNPWN